MAMPSYSMSARPCDTLKMTNVGPGSHRPECSMNAVYRTAPSYSLSARSKQGQTSKTPGPALLNLPPVLGSGLANKTSAPMYSFTGRTNVGGLHYNQPKTPGPATYNIPSMNVCKNRLPEYTMRPQLALLTQRYKNPGPGTHRPEKVTVTHVQLPSYTFGMRHSDYKKPVLM
uniref:ciliary microtubule associated protein 1A-like n=1 Tax=Myxine glutinosa TaxID=7769 RepID=UPI00358E3671